MATVHRFEELEVWKTARTLTRTVYQLTTSDAFSKDFGLRDQIQKAAVSVMSNIAEGFDSSTQSTFIQFLGYARRSAAEVKSQLYVAIDLNYISQDEFDTAFDEVDKCSRQLFRFIQYLRSRPNEPRVREDGVLYIIDDAHVAGEPS
jgi:four helix bundle protein